MLGEDAVEEVGFADCCEFGDFGLLRLRLRGCLSDCGIVFLAGDLALLLSTAVLDAFFEFAHALAAFLL